MPKKHTSFLFVNFSACRFLVLRREKQADTEESEKCENKLNKAKRHKTTREKQADTEKSEKCENKLNKAKRHTDSVFPAFSHSRSGTNKFNLYKKCNIK